MKNKREQVEKGILLVKGGVWPWQGESRELLLYYIAHQWPRRGGRKATGGQGDNSGEQVTGWCQPCSVVDSSLVKDHPGVLSHETTATGSCSYAHVPQEMCSNGHCRGPSISSS